MTLSIVVIWLRYLLKGIPVVIKDGARDWPMKTWDCQHFQKNFPTAKFRTEYTTKNFLVLENTLNQLIPRRTAKIKMVITFEIETVKKRAYHHRKAENLSSSSVASSFSDGFYLKSYDNFNFCRAPWNLLV